MQMQMQMQIQEQPSQSKPQSQELQLQQQQQLKQQQLKQQQQQQHQEVECKNTNDKMSSNKNTKNKTKEVISREDYELILEQINAVQMCDLEGLLMIHEANFLKFRNETYAQAMREGITAHSPQKDRLKVIEKVVGWLFDNIEPPDEYTKKTDIRHFREVAALAVTMCKNRKRKASLTLIIACWLHDVERFIPCVKCDYLPEHVDKYRKQVTHAINSARMAMIVLKGAPVTTLELQHIYDIITQHDKPTDTKVELFGKELLGFPSPDIEFELQILMDADALAFFAYTITEFVLFKSTTNTPEWIWTRIHTNVQRLRPDLRRKAIQYMEAMDLRFRQLMGFNPKSLEPYL